MDVQYFKVAYELWKFHEYHMQKLSASKKKKVTSLSSKDLRPSQLEHKS